MARIKQIYVLYSEYASIVCEIIMFTVPISYTFVADFRVRYLNVRSVRYYI